MINIERLAGRVFIAGLAFLILLAVISYFGKHGTTKTTTEMHWQESPGGASGTVRDSHRR